MMKEAPKEHSLRWIKAVAVGRLTKKPHSRSARRGLKKAKS